MTVTGDSGVLEEGSDYSVEYDLDDNGVAMLEFKGRGAYGGSLYSVINVNKKAASISGVPETWKTDTGTDFMQLKPQSGQGSDFRYDSTDESVVAVTWDGMVFPVGKGSADIVVSLDESDGYYGAKTVMHVTVDSITPDFSLESSEIPADTADFWLPIETLCDGELTFSADSNKLLTITKDGKIHLNGKTGTAKVTVKSAATERFKACTKNFTIKITPMLLEKGTEAKSAGTAIKQAASDKDPEGAVYRKLQLKAKKVSKNQIRIEWNKVKGAKRYVVYGAKCGKKYKKLSSRTGTAYTQKKLKKGTYYKYLVLAVDKDGKVITTSKVAYIAAGSGNAGNHKSVRVSSGTKLTLAAGKSKKIDAKALSASSKQKVKKYRALSYESSNTKVAKVTSGGKIRALKKGSCKIYVYAQNGVCRIIKVTVK